MPGGKLISSFVPGACQDASGAVLEPDFTSVDVMQSKLGRLLLLERRNGYAPLVVENYFARNSTLVFQVIVKGAGLVREWRIPGAPGAPALVQVGRQLTERSGTAGFEAGLASTRLRCTLVAKGTDLPASSTNPVP